ncbi:MAG: 3'-5' exonuclease, partial [Caldisphaera sp.]|nr:3'-5' exonuclease [Caldisphaera sp.]
MRIEGLLLDIDTLAEDDKSVIRLTVKTKEGIVTLFDTSFLPYLYLLPRNSELNEETISSLKFPNGTGIAEIAKVEKVKMQLLNKEVMVFKVYAHNAKDIPTFKEYLQEFGTCYEYDIPFWKRYLIDKDISPMLGISAEVKEENNRLVVESIESTQAEGIDLKHICFDIETYNPKKVPRPKEDPVILISLANESIAKVISARHINRDFVIEVKNEKELIEKFVEIVKREDFDIIAGYNSSNFDIPYLIERSKRVGAKFELGRYPEEVSNQHHGLLELVKI